MSFVDLQLRRYYKTYKHDVIKEFYTPILKESVLYQRAVGFFSSTALIDLSRGLKGLIKNHGHIQFLVSPRLTNEDITAINKGYESREIIGKALMRDFKDPENYFEEERLNFLAYLIEEGFLEIKVAFTPPQKSKGMYHEKVGIVTDSDGNKIVFTGSMNETINAFHNNSESIVVFKSWEESKSYVDEMQDDFNALWNEDDPDLEIIEFPKVLRDKFKVMRNTDYDKYIVEDINIDEDDEYWPKTIIEAGIPHIPDGFIIRDYQKDAIKSWENNDYIGIFDMATGTGKTYTGLCAITSLYEKVKRLAIIIVCPYQHLVEQWVDDIEYFNMRPIIGYSASKQKNWKKRLEADVYDFNLGIINSFCFVTTNATYSSKFVCEIMASLGKDTLLVVDEAHNFGAPNLLNKLYPEIQYRLALSATLERHGDEIGTNALMNYFGKKCIEYTLKKAIDDHKLTHYKYYPILVYLDDDEYEKYQELSYLASKECYEDKNGAFTITEKGKHLLMQRSAIVAGARNKLSKLKELMEPYKNDDHILVYCGATRVHSFEHDISDPDEEGERQIEAVSKMLGIELGMKVRHFTSNETAEEREIIKECFAAAAPYQALIAIKCLDEGVNIPSIRTAFILASTTNPKEYIQRRGRVLRLANDKPYAVIYDFVTLTRPLYLINEHSPDFKYERALAMRELARIKEFGNIADNSSDSNELIEEIESKFNIDCIEKEDEYDGNEFRQ